MFGGKANRAKSASATANLIRVRNNQRRSRARRREYVAELERKIQEYEAGEVPTRSVVPEETLRRLQEENRKLRELLRQFGVEQNIVERYLRDPVDNDHRETAGIVIDGAEASVGLQMPAWVPVMSNVGVPPESEFPEAGAGRLQDWTDDALTDSFLDQPDDISLAEDLGLYFDAAQEATLVQDLTPPIKATPTALCTAPSISSAAEVPNFRCSPSSLPDTRQCDSGTTLCSEAYEMLRQHNKKGVDMIEIGIRLWNGFTKGDERGCKVENKLLFSVLEFISG